MPSETLGPDCARGASEPGNSSSATADASRNIPNRSTAQVRVVNARPIVRNTLRGFFDLQLASGMVLVGCALHRKRSHVWVQMPARSFEASDGTISWVPTVDFVDRETRSRFQTIAVAAASQAFMVAMSTQSRMSLAMLRGRGLVIGLLRVVGEDDRTLAAIGELEARGGQVKRADDRLIAVGAHLRQLVLQPFAG